MNIYPNVTQQDLINSFKLVEQRSTKNKIEF